MDEKYSVEFTYGDNIALLFGRMKKTLSIKEWEDFYKKLDNIEDYDEAIELAEKYVEVING